MQTIRRGPFVILLLVAVISSFYTASSPASSLDKDIGRLMPADAPIVVVVPSIEVVAEKWGELVEIFAPAQRDSMDLLVLLEDVFEGSLDHFAVDRPWALGMNVPTGEDGDWQITLVLPLRDNKISDEQLRSFNDMDPVRNGDHVAYSSHVDFEKSSKTSHLLKNLPEAQVIARADVEALAPTIESWLGTIPMGDSDSAAGNMFVKILKPILDSARTLEVTLDSENQGLTLGIGLDVLRNSPLDPPSEHPSFDAALDLARAMPQDGGITSVSAINLSELGPIWTDVIQGLYQLSPQFSDADIQAFVAEAMEFMELYSQPLAWWFNFDLSGLHALGAIRVDDPEMWHTKVADLLARLSELNLGWVVEELESEMAGVRSFKMSMDLDALSAEMDEDDVATMNSTLGMVNALLPPMHVLAQDDLLVIALDLEAERAFEDFFTRLASNDSELSPGLVAALDWAGDSKFVSAWDVSGIVSVIGAFTGMSIEPETIAQLQQLLFMSMDTSKQRYDMRLRLDMNAISAIVDLFTGGDDGADSEADLESSSLSTMSQEDAQALADEVSKRVEEIRGLEFKQAVPVQIVSDEVAAKHFVSRIEKFMPDGQMARMSEMYQDLGLLEDGTNLEEMLFDLLEEQAGGYYDPGEKTMFLLDDMPAGTASILLAHELTHALDDQHFGIDALLATAEGNTDHQTALSAVFEGSGTLLMSVYLVEEMMAGRLGMDDIMAYQESEAGKAESLNAAPSLMQRALLAPYLVGQSFVQRGTGNMMAPSFDADDVNAAFTNPPRSTKQVLHADKYWNSEGDDAIAMIDLGHLEGLFGAGWVSTESGVLGELEIAELVGNRVHISNAMSLMQASAWTNGPATGWNGDAWLLMQNGDDTATVAASLWETESDAQEFVAALDLPEGALVLHDGLAVVIVAGEAGGSTNERVAQAVLKRLKK